MSNKKGFTLIEMIIAAAIFASVVVAAAAAFGSSSRTQVVTRDTIRLQEFGSTTSEKIFNDLKSCTAWGEFESAGNRYKIKGFATANFQESGSLINLYNGDFPAKGANLIFGFYPNGDHNGIIVYYSKDNKLYRGDIPNPIFSDDAFYGVHVYYLLNHQSGLAFQEVSDANVSFDSIYFSGINYVSLSKCISVCPSVKRIQPFLSLSLIMKGENSIAGTQTSYEVKSAISSRNYAEEPK